MNLMGLPIGNVLSLESYYSGSGPHGSANQIEDRGLPRPIGSNEPHDLPLIHIEIGISHCGEPAKALSQTCKVLSNDRRG